MAGMPKSGRETARTRVRSQGLTATFCGPGCSSLLVLASVPPQAHTFSQNHQAIFPAFRGDLL